MILRESRILASNKELHSDYLSVIRADSPWNRREFGVLPKKNLIKVCRVRKKVYLCSPNSKGTRQRPKNDHGLIR